MDSDFKERVASDMAAAKAIYEGYRRLERLRCQILEQTMDDTAHIIGTRILSESMALRRKQRGAA